MRLRHAIDKTQLDDLARAAGGPVRVLASAQGPDTTVVGLAHAFAYRSGDGWRLVGYHELNRGGWQATDGVFWWEDLAGERHELVLTETGRFPELFRERVTATLLADKTVGQGTCQARIVARRNLAGVDAEVTWQAFPLPGTDPTQPEYRRLVSEGIERLGADYGIG
ncbi:MAG: hypothetical protein Q3997_06255 [Propionibacteriaceae bacterium]|nr:hypothetical protein [Propionibacteriaceae bacterium]